MRFKSIEFFHYRCFNDGKIEFEEKGEKNINLILAPNGGGKTEMLFAFWWTLYDFDFSKLRGKEDTPYALNSDIYKELEHGEVGYVMECSVTLEFEHNGKIYRVVKKCEYRKTDKKIKEEVYQTLSSYNDKFELQLPERDPNKIEKTLNRIIPKAILYGIIFDGERMQKLSSVDEKSKNAIGGVISDITNMELIERCILHFKDIRKEINGNAKKLAAQTGQNKIEDIISRISELDLLIDQNISTKTQKVARKEQVELIVQNNSEELKKIDEIRELERKRQIRVKDINEYGKMLDTFYKNFSASLMNGYLYIVEPLLKSVDEIIQKYDVPAELTVPAVKNIQKMKNCICGRCMDANAYQALEDLILSLPPDNINSTLAEIVRQARIATDESKEKAKQDYDYIRDYEQKIKNAKDDIASYSSQIMEGGIEEAKELEKENKELEKELHVLEHEIKVLSEDIDKQTKERDEKTELRDELSKHDGEMERYNIQLAFVEKCLVAFEKIKDVNKQNALDIINTKLDAAYKLLSEDASRGRRIYIVQYDEARRNQMVVYLESACNRIIDYWKETAEYNTLLAKGFTNKEIKEKAIMQCLDANSTGQSKINTLSFVKAILDYSNEPKDENGIEIRKDYPLLIDAPFGDIAGDNRINSSSELHTFANQIILMLDTDIYIAVSPFLGKYVSNIYEMNKIDDHNCTTITLKEIL